ncbi:MAG: EpsI family protein [Phycisphaerae bacterium]|nr:EpsI family protein [Phycisphaerae bacterium]
MTAIVLLAVSGVGYRVLAMQLARPTESVPLPRGSLSELPLRLSDWIGRDVPLSEAIIRRTDSDDHVNRVYARHGGTQVVGLFVAYGVRGRDLMPHRPDVCYPGAGWALREKRVISIPLDNDRVLECQVYRFSRGGLDTSMVTVLNYYVVDGEYCPDVSLLRSKVWRGSGRSHYMAQVQISCGENALIPATTALEAARSFAVASADPIRALLPDRPSEADSAPSGAADSPSKGTSQE